MIVAVTMDASVDSFLLALKDLGTMGLGITDPVRDPKAWDIKQLILFNATRMNGSLFKNGAYTHLSNNNIAMFKAQHDHQILHS